MAKPKVHFVEVVDDPELRKKEAAASKALRKFFPDAGKIRLFRTADGEIGFQLNISVTGGAKKQLDDAYRAVMRVVGEDRGRPRGTPTVQTKLRLPEPTYRVLKREAKASRTTLSGLVSNLVREAFG